MFVPSLFPVCSQYVPTCNVSDTNAVPTVPSINHKNIIKIINTQVYTCITYIYRKFADFSGNTGNTSQSVANSGLVGRVEWEQSGNIVGTRKGSEWEQKIAA